MLTAADAKRQVDPELQRTLGGDRDRWLDGWLLAVAAAGLGFAIQVRDGLYTPWGFVGLTVALAAGLGVFLAPRREDVERRGERPAAVVFGAAIGFNFLQLVSYRLPGSWHGVTATPFFYACVAVAALLSAGMVARPTLARPLLLGLIAVFCAIGAWIILRVPQPYMDVWMLQTEGLKAFLHGHNPFATAFPDVYHRPELYAPGAMGADGLVHQGFPYPPMVFWLDLPGYVIGGDYRWSNLVAMALTALLIAWSAPGRIAPLAAALFLFTPRAFFVLESGWTEPVTALLLAATVFCACRVPRLAPVCLGLFLCSKQYLVWAVPPVLLLAGQPRDWRRILGKLAIALVVGCVVSLPLILWDVRAYLAANVAVAQGAAFRTDALSYLALFANVTHVIPSAGAATVIGFGSAAAATLLVCRYGRPTPAGYAAAVAVVHLVFFAFYKFAFCNYDWFLIAAFCSAAGALRVSERGTEC